METNSPSLHQTQGGSVFLSRFVAALDLGVLGGHDATLRDRQGWLLRELRLAVEAHPPRTLSDFSLVHVGRAGFGEASIFEVCVLDCRGGTVTLARNEPITSSTVLKLGSAAVSTERGRWLDGSGAALAGKTLRRWQHTAYGGTSRAVFSAFCTALQSGQVETIGGPPQLVGLRKQGSSMRFGVVIAGETYIAGTPIRLGAAAEVECFNERFERVDLAGKRRAGAAQHEAVDSADF